MFKDTSASTNSINYFLKNLNNKDEHKDTQKILDLLIYKLRNLYIKGH